MSNTIKTATHFVTWYGGRVERVAILEDKTYESPYPLGPRLLGTMHIWSEAKQAERWISFGLYNAVSVQPLSDWQH